MAKTRSSFNQQFIDQNNEDGELIARKTAIGLSNINIGDTGGADNYKIVQSNELSSQISFNNSLSSTASTQKSNAFKNTMKDFKKSMGVKHTPKSINLLNRLAISILCILIILQGVDYSLLNSTIANQQNQSMVMLNG